MELVAAVRPVDDVADSLGGDGRYALDQQVRAFVLVARVAGRRGVALRENEVAGDAETGRPVWRDLTEIPL